MYEDNATPEMPKLESKPSMFDRAKRFARKYETPLACAATSTFVFAITYKSLGMEIDKLKFSKACVLSELEEEAKMALDYAMFVDHKNLRGQFEKFAAELEG